MFLRNRAVKMSFIKDKAETSETDQNPFENVEVLAAYSEVAKDFVTHAALTIGGVYAACQIIKRICK